MSRRSTFTVLNAEFVVDGSFELVKELGSGSYDRFHQLCVCFADSIYEWSGKLQNNTSTQPHIVNSSARNTVTGETVAIKKVTKIFSKKILTKRALRELKLLHHFRGHKNITCLYDMDIIDPAKFDEVYLYEELMEADLHAIIRSGQPLSDQHYQSFIYQTLCGLKYIHSASVLHRDLKPGNLLVNADCELKICDFGLARGFENDPAAGFMTEYVATRWYRAPEIMLSFQNYTTAIDCWSVGTILAELFGGKPIFKGRDYVDQLNQILNVLGTPSERSLRRVGSPRAQEYIRSLPYKSGVPWQQQFPGANPLGLDLLAKLLTFDPSERETCEQALNHPYLAVWHDPLDEPVCPVKFEFAFEDENTDEGMRRLILEEVASFRQSVRQPASRQSSSGSKRQDSLPIPSRDIVHDNTIPDGTQYIRESQERIADSPADEVPSAMFEQGLQRQA